MAVTSDVAVAYRKGEGPPANKTEDQSSSSL